VRKVAPGPGSKGGVGASESPPPAPRIKWIMTAACAICRDQCERPGAGLQLRSVPAAVDAWAPARRLANGRTRSRQGPIPATQDGATAECGFLRAPARDRRLLGHLSAKDPITWTKPTRCSSTPHIRKKPGWWCCATVG